MRENKKQIQEDSEPRTWACECGQMNLEDSARCFLCDGEKDECWDEADRKRFEAEGFQVYVIVERKRKR